MKKFFRSQNAHKRLARKYGASTNDYDWVKANYHACCVQAQKKNKRVLTQKEKKEIFKTTQFYYFN